jgi:hypothetical protein
VILALKASEIATYCGNRERGGSRIEVKDGLLFYGVYIERDRTAEDKCVKLSFPVLSHSADSSF